MFRALASATIVSAPYSDWILKPESKHFQCITYARLYPFFGNAEADAETFVGR